MQKILLDTNLLICSKNQNDIDKKVLELTKILYDSNNYRIVIHPMALKNLSNIKNPNEREIFFHKIKAYSLIENVPKASENFNNVVRCSKTSNDMINNNLLYAIYTDYVSYLITNDKKLKNKAKKINLSKRVLRIDDAINLFKSLEEKETRNQAFINYEFLYNIDLEDEFFDSLKTDYKDFENWYKKKTLDGNKAFITRHANNKIGSFLMLKTEDENEDYSEFKKPFKKGRRLKVATFKVANTGNKIGESYIKIIISEAIKNRVDEIYVTVFKKQEALIKLFLEYGFKQKTTKMTAKTDGTFEQELVFVKKCFDQVDNHLAQNIIKN